MVHLWFKNFAVATFHDWEGRNETKGKSTERAVQKEHFELGRERRCE